MTRETKKAEIQVTQVADVYVMTCDVCKKEIQFAKNQFYETTPAPDWLGVAVNSAFFDFCSWACLHKYAHNNTEDLT